MNDRNRIVNYYKKDIDGDCGMELVSKWVICAAGVQLELKLTANQIMKKKKKTSSSSSQATVFWLRASTE